jgi:hypothetical protein
MPISMEIPASPGDAFPGRSGMFLSFLPFGRFGLHFRARQVEMRPSCRK